jgi:hypothetical protein
VFGSGLFYIGATNISHRCGFGLSLALPSQCKRPSFARGTAFDLFRLNLIILHSVYRVDYLASRFRFILGAQSGCVAFFSFY